jgi:hypothetical protein
MIISSQIESTDTKLILIWSHPYLQIFGHVEDVVRVTYFGTWSVVEELFEQLVVRYQPMYCSKFNIFISLSYMK